MGNQYSLIKRVLNDYRKKIAEGNLDFSSETSPSQDSLPEEVQRAVTCINNFLFDQKLTVGWMKDQCYINGHNFSGKFKYYLGRTPKQYIVHHRVDTAKKILLLEDLQSISISTIAYELGFSNASSFTRIFKRKTGKAPNRWREKLGEK